ncbi:MAG: hypothetical protein AVDCRST_MAG64-2856, partial [uncultured Phycisphaerae bacterium]
DVLRRDPPRPTSQNYVPRLSGTSTPEDAIAPSQACSPRLDGLLRRIDQV